LAEDEDYEQDSEAYRKWRSGEDNDRYASSRNPTETGSKSGSYSIPQSNDEYALPGEEDNSRGGSWLDGDISWPAIIAAFLVFALISAVVFAFVMSSTEESGSMDIVWANTEGIIVKQYDANVFITEEYCKDENDDGYLDDWECWKDFVYQISLVYNYTLDSGNYTLSENLEFWEGEWIDDIEREGEEQLFQKFINETNERIALNSTVTITYNPNDPGDAFSEFVGPPEEPIGFVGWFLMCCGGMLCIPVIFAGGIIGWARNAKDMNGGYGQNGRGPFGGFGYNDDRGGRRNGRAVRRTGGSSRSGGGGRSGSGSRGSGGSRSGGGGRRR
tara:strand:+ start:62 stop:1051 length:990 start_codon:yes stop_codon:yes gene_type:complete